MLMSGEQRLVVAEKIGEKRCAVVASRKLDMVEKMAKKKDHPNMVMLLFSGSDGEKSEWKIEAKGAAVLCSEISAALAQLD